MSYNYSDNAHKNAKLLRKKQTQEERKLWYEFLRDLPIPFKRQKPIGNYILDFYCASKKIAIEIDGSQHFEKDVMEYDSARTRYLNSFGITVLRYTNSDINCRFDAVCEDILCRLGI